ncbi:AT-rich interactive domain-containing protein 4A isoform X2 [Rhineura floridana]|uniref:AT-rich interactive domain-containing protein 4A isoform X2 n=1 Tax=Rhineura floridana TaxID=261503 RepID=UPI002AC84B03|nr:AT-rich interactive domain-containing protein 4A isoform X2 [Rhineura floridana]
MKAADEPAYLTVGTDVSAKYRGAFCEAKIKAVKRLVKVKVILKQDNSTQLVQDDQVKGPLRVGAVVETKTSDGSFQEAIVSKLTDASWYTVVFDDGDERTLRRTSLCLKGERHFAESETLDQLPLTNPEHFGTPVIGKKSNRGRRSSLPVNEDEKEEESSEEEEEDKRRLNDELLGKVVSVTSSSEEAEWYPALVLSPSCSDDTAVKKDQCLVRSFADSKFYSVARKDIEELDILNITKPELSSRTGLQEASSFFSLNVIPSTWKMDMREILESSSSDEEDGGEAEIDEEEEKREHKEEEVVPEEELDPEERENFLQQLYKFMEDRGTPINKPPVLGYKDLNLFKLFRLVYQQGGCDNIDSGAIWKQIYMDLGIPILNSAASYNVKTAYRKYLYGFEEYCRSANIQFRTIHHNEPKVIEVVQEPEEPMEESVKEEPEMSPVEVQNEEEENDCSSESEKEETEQRSPRGRRRLVRDVTVPKKEGEDDKMQEKLRDSNKENKDVEDMPNNAEKRENELPLGNRKTMPKQKEKKAKKEEESDRESDEEEERREELGNRGESEGEEGDEDAEPCLTGTRVKVKYGRGKTQKIYEASIKSTENDDGEVLYLVHYYGWNVRYDEWVKADRIIWPVEKGGAKKKQKKKTKSKEDGEKDEKREEEKQKAKRGRPPLKSTLLSNLSYGLPKTPNSESKPGARSGSSSLPDCSPLSNGMEGMPRRQTRRSSGMLDSDRGSNDSISSDSDVDEASEKNMNEEFSPASSEPEKDEKQAADKPDEEIPKISHVLKENDRNQLHPLEALKLEVEESEQVVHIFGNKSDQVEDTKREIEKSPKAKGRRNRTRDSSLENVKITQLNQEEVTSEHLSDSERLDMSSLDTKGLSTVTENETDPCAKDKKLSKRKTLEQPSPDKRVRLESEMDVPNIVSEGRTNECSRTEECKNFSADDSLRNENEEMPSLVAESDQRLQVQGGKRFDCSEENRNTPLKDEDDSMPQIGPETLLCHEVDLDDIDEKDKIGPENLVGGKQDSSPISDPPALPPVGKPNFSVASPLTLSQDESRSIKSESDITIEVDSVAEESQEGLCESESANGFEACTTSSNCSIAIPEREIGERGQKRPGDNSSSSLAKKQKRTPKRASTIAKNEKNGTGQSSDSEDLPALDSSNKCTPLKHIGVSKPQKLTRSPARVLSPNIKDGDKDKQREKNHQNVSPRVYKWSVQLNELDNMSSTERISFLQEKLQEIRKYYMSLKSEVATIDRRRKRLKKKDREVSHTGASMSSASSDTGMSPSSSSPPQNVLAVECR